MLSLQGVASPSQGRRSLDKMTTTWYTIEVSQHRLVFIFKHKITMCDEGTCSSCTPATTADDTADTPVEAPTETTEEPATEEKTEEPVA